MRILVTNDDGIFAPGILKLASAAKALGEVWVVAPAHQCSAMSHKITVGAEMELKEQKDYPVEGITAYSLGGTPADCIKVGVELLMEQKPDVIFSGINNGYNAGLEICYSGTIAAAMEGCMKGIPSIAFSMEEGTITDVLDRMLLPIARELTEKPAGKNKIWNVNFPSCTLEEYRGIVYDCPLAPTQYYLDHYEEIIGQDGSRRLSLRGQRIGTADEGTDLRVLLDRYISVSRITNLALR